MTCTGTGEEFPSFELFVSSVSSPLDKLFNSIIFFPNLFIVFSTSCPSHHFDIILIFISSSFFPYFPL